MARKQKKPLWLTILEGAKGVAEGIAKATDETKKVEKSKRAWQKKDCGTPC